MPYIKADSLFGATIRQSNIFNVSSWSNHYHLGVTVAYGTSFEMTDFDQNSTKNQFLTRKSYWYGFSVKGRFFNDEIWEMKYREIQEMKYKRLNTEMTVNFWTQKYKLKWTSLISVVFKQQILDDIQIFNFYLEVEYFE